MNEADLCCHRRHKVMKLIEICHHLVRLALLKALLDGLGLLMVMCYSTMTPKLPDVFHFYWLIFNDLLKLADYF